jgi:tetratricopeptide (TPR) repeat protein
VLKKRRGMPLVLVQMASLEQEAGHLEAAISAAREALTLGPGDAQTAAQLGDYLVQGGRAREAVLLLTPYARHVDPHPEVLVGLGTALAELGQGAEALRVLGEARTRDPGNAMVLLDIGTVHLMRRDYAKAQASVEAALSLNPSLARGHNVMGVVQAETGHPEEAVRHWKSAVDLDPRDLDTLFNLGALLIKMHKATEARPFLERFLRDAPPEAYRLDRAKVAGWLQAGG